MMLPNQRRRAEIRPAEGRAWFFSCSSVGLAAEVPSAGLGCVTIPGGHLSRPASACGMRVEKLWAGNVKGCGWCGRAEHVRALEAQWDSLVSGCVAHAT